VSLFIQDGTPPESRLELLRLGAVFLMATATFQLFDAMAMTMSGALRGAGDAVIPGIVTVVLSWTLIVIGGELAVRLLPGLGSLGPWLGASSYIIALALFFTWRFARGRWKSIRLVDTGPAVPEGISDGIGPQAEIGLGPVLDPSEPG
jgi:MATE family multidrug resistance protein